MRRLQFTTDARNDLDAIMQYIARSTGNAPIAIEFVMQLVARCERLASLPGIHGTERPDIRGDLRSTPCRSYIIYFRYLDQIVQIVAIAHGRQDPLLHFDDREFPDDD